MVRKGWVTVYITDKEALLLDKYIQKHFPKLRREGKANRSAVIRDVVEFWAKHQDLAEKGRDSQGKK